VSFNEITVDSSALRYAREAGIELTAQRGVDPATLNAMREAGYAGIRMSARDIATRAVQGTRLAFSGDTGITQKAADAASAQIFSQAANVELGVEQYNEQQRERAVQAMLNLYSTLDQMNLQAAIANEQLRQNETSWFGDVLGALGTVGTFLGGVGTLYGAVKKR